MRLLTDSIYYDTTIKLAQTLEGIYTDSVIFHCYWNGVLNEKHLYSILSFYYFNVYKNKHKIILWLENNIYNTINDEISKYAEIKYFSLNKEIKDTFLNDITLQYRSELTFYSDMIRNILLYKYGGCWFDLDCLCLRSFDPIFANYKDSICLYQWECKNYPNNAIYISLNPRSDTMRKNIEFIISRNKGWGFQEALLTFDLNLDMLILPCSWFDPNWIINPYKKTFDFLFDISPIEYNFDNFYRGSFCYHWHNSWNKHIHKNSPIMNLINIIKNDLK